MITGVLRYTLIAGLIFYFILILIFLKNRALTLKYTLLWILAGIVMLVMTIFPHLLFEITGLLGIQSGMNGLYIICIAFIIAILMALTSIVSKQKSKLKTLTQEMAILEKRVRDIEKSNMEKIK